MSFYPWMIARIGPVAAITSVVLVRAGLIVLVAILSDIGFTTFTYLHLAK